MTRHRPQRNEHGIATLYVTVIAVAVLATAALALDGARLLAARRDAATTAASAARAAAQYYDETALNHGDLALSADAAPAAERLLDDLGYPDRTVTVEGGTIRVVVRTRVPMLLLGIAGVATRQVQGAATVNVHAEL